MNAALEWIKAYVPDLECTDQEFMDKMTLSGTKCEGYERMDKNLEKIVIGQITKIEKHPDADKLIICQVNIGTEEIQIVTGAPNVKVGDKVIYSKYAGTDVELEGEKYIIVKQNDILAIVE